MPKIEIELPLDEAMFIDDKASELGISLDKLFIELIHKEMALNEKEQMKLDSRDMH